MKGYLLVSTPTTIHRWVKKDVPALPVENYVYSPDNFIDQMIFQLFKTYDGKEYHDVANNWKKISAELMESEDFGRYLDADNYWFDKAIHDLALENDSELEKVKKIYSYIQNNYVCTNYSYESLTTTLKDIVKRKSGTVGDINLLLIAMLRRIKASAFPVLLSTRTNGRCRSDYPQMQRINYVICKAKIDSNIYYLDATNPFLPFGKLSAKCYNGYARVVAWDSIAVDLNPELAKNYCQVTNFINNGGKNEMEGTSTHNMGFFESLNEKREIAELTLVEYKKKAKQLYPEEMLIDSVQVENFETHEKDLAVKAAYKLKIFENEDIVYFNPMMGEAVMKNPFAATERIYPVEMPYVKDDIYTLNMEIPKGYMIEELPKSTRISLNENDGMFEYIISVENETIYLKCRIKLKKAIFESDDYQSLRDFYTYIVKKEAEQIVFKKIK